jgi:DNA-directed RNA polymerase beta subunit
MRPQIEALMGMVAGLRSPKVAEEQQTQQQAEPEQQAQQKQAATQRASFETFKANTELAGQIIEQLNETNGKIDALVTAGRKFASARAKQDVHSIVAKVSEIVQTVDLAQPWVKADLADLASKSAEIHALFAPAKV